MTAKKKKISFFKKIIYAFIFILIGIGSVGGYLAYKNIFQSGINLGNKKSQIIYIHTGSKFADVLKILEENNILKNRASFEWLCEKKKYKSNIKPGRYRILAKMSNNALVNMLKAGLQEPVEINFNGLHTINQLITRVCLRIEADSSDMLKAINDNSFLNKMNLNTNNVQSLFIPVTYQFRWNTSVDGFFERMVEQYNLFWNDSRRKLAKAIGYTPTEISILASIVQAEQCCKNEEKKIIAGLYINRLKKEMALQSDPTVIYALNDFTIQRVSLEDTKFDSPYNTYQNKGLPPGPIGFVSTSSLDAVLNYDKNEYIFMCAKEDLSGSHYFSKTLEQHNIYRKKYRDALDKRGIH